MSQSLPCVSFCLGVCVLLGEIGAGGGGCLLWAAKFVQERGSGSQRGRQGTGNRASGLGVRGEGTGGVPRMVCPCVISRRQPCTSRVLALPSNATVQMLIYSSCHISGVMSRHPSALLVSTPTITKSTVSIRIQAKTNDLFSLLINLLIIFSINSYIDNCLLFKMSGNTDKCPGDAMKLYVLSNKHSKT